MRQYTRIDNGIAFEFIETDKKIEDLYPPAFIWVDITDMDPKPEYGWTYAEGVFSPPMPEVRTPEAIRRINVAYRDMLLSMATLAIAPLQDAVDLDEATAEEEAALLAWKKFRIAVNRVNLAIDGVTWPDFPPQYYSRSEKM